MHHSHERRSQPRTVILAIGGTTKTIQIRVVIGRAAIAAMVNFVSINNLQNALPTKRPACPSYLQKIRIRVLLERFDFTLAVDLRYVFAKDMKN